MGNESILLQVGNAGFHVSNDKLIPAASIGLPMEELRFTERGPIFWHARVVTYDPDSGALVLDVLDYTAQGPLPDMCPLRNITSLRFTRLDWSQWEPQLTSYPYSSLKPFIFEETPEVHTPRQDWHPPVVRADTHPYNTPPPPKPPPVAEVVNVKWVDTTFHDGLITFQVNVGLGRQKVECTVQNAWSRKQFEHIKDYIKRASGNSATYTAEVLVDTRMPGPPVISADSETLRAINKDLLDKVNVERTLKARKAAAKEGAAAIVTAEELFESVHAKDAVGNLFDQSDKQILETLLLHGDVRNSKQLRYLAGELQAMDQKLRFTLHPVFGFLFFIRGKERDHFCWELLKSNASYLWSFPKCHDANAVLSQYDRLEVEISRIRAIGREEYRRNARTEPDVNGMAFSAIHHTKVEVAPAAAFDSWRIDLESRL